MGGLGPWNKTFFVEDVFLNECYKSSILWKFITHRELIYLFLLRCLYNLCYKYLRFLSFYNTKIEETDKCPPYWGRKVL